VIIPTKHTFSDVVKELVVGLENGQITLADSPAVSPAATSRTVRTALARRVVAPFARVFRHWRPLLVGAILLLLMYWLYGVPAIPRSDDLRLGDVLWIISIIVVAAAVTLLSISLVFYRLMPVWSVPGSSADGEQVVVYPQRQYKLLWVSTITTVAITLTLLVMGVWFWGKTRRPIVQSPAGLLRATLQVLPAAKGGEVRVSGDGAYQVRAGAAVRLIVISPRPGTALILFQEPGGTANVTRFALPQNRALDLEVLLPRPGTYRVLSVVVDEGKVPEVDRLLAPNPAFASPDVVRTSIEHAVADGKLTWAALGEVKIQALPEELPQKGAKKQTDK
jgi:hypothetical protein